MARENKVTDVLSKAKFIGGAALLFLVAYALQINLTIPLLLLILFFFLKFVSKHAATNTNILLELALLFVIIFATADFIILKGWSSFFIPFASISMLSVILFENLTISLLLTLACALATASLAPDRYEVLVIFLISGVASMLLVRYARKRTVIMRAGIVIGIIQALVYFFLTHFSTTRSDEYLILFFNGVASSFIVFPMLLIFEIMFQTVTNISLLELADFNHPLLRRMVQEAPGTYHHSLVVGNLSDAACTAVGAHALLARIGAYYHDIGKLSKPEYFSENQYFQTSKHETLTPTMSKLVIMNHVKEGLELAKKYKLCVSITDFIAQHHGTSLVYYFYRRALEDSQDIQEVKEEGFRYPGPKPRTKEAAIVLLADSVEAAARSVKDFAPNKIEEIVHKIINNKFIDGQLDECDLTLKDLERIAGVFIHVLSGMYHSRVIYPESSTGEPR